MSGLKIVVAGAAGRMGAAVIRAIAAQPGLTLHAALDRADSPATGRDAGLLAGLEANGVIVGSDAPAALLGADAIIDFSAPAASVTLSGLAAVHGLVHVIGTTGCSPADEAEFDRAAAEGARIVKSGNFSPGVVLLASLVERAAQALPDFDVEILEMHHRNKVDAPSGTALMLGQAAARGRNIALAENSVSGRDGHTGKRADGVIGFAALRGGSVVGDHTVILAGPSERIELVHRAEDRAIFANGAVRAAIWAAAQRAGRYDMADVLGLSA